MSISVMSEDHDDSADLEWVPPSEAEQKILTARRERSDKISKLMGNYLLKGYKMLATTCNVCGTIELEDKQKQLYCVACEEVDCEENSKDNPAINPQAARTTMAEGRMLAEIESQMMNAEEEEVVQVRRVNDRFADPSQFMHRPSPLQQQSRLRSGLRQLSTNSSNTGQPVPLMHSSLDAVFAKMSAATATLAETEDIDTSRQLVNLIKECADCALALKNAVNAHI